MYYTVLSNLLVCFFFFTGYLIYLMTRTDDKWQSAGVLRVQGWCDHVHHDYLCGLTIFYWPQLRLIFYRLENFLCHYIVPTCFSFGYFSFLTKPSIPLVWSISWTSVPLIYMDFSLLTGFFQDWYSKIKDNPFPYFFLNVFKHKWPICHQDVLIIFVAYLVLLYLE